MANVKIQALDNGPFVVNGDADLVDGQGKVIETKEGCYLCRCGLPKGICAINFQLHGTFHSFYTASSIRGL